MLFAWYGTHRRLLGGYLRNTADGLYTIGRVKEYCRFYGMHTAIVVKSVFLKDITLVVFSCNIGVGFAVGRKVYALNGSCCIHAGFNREPKATLLLVNRHSHQTSAHKHGGHVLNILLTECYGCRLHFTAAGHLGKDGGSYRTVCLKDVRNWLGKAGFCNCRVVVAKAVHDTAKRSVACKGTGSRKCVRVWLVYFVGLGRNKGGTICLRYYLVNLGNWVAAGAYNGRLNGAVSVEPHHYWQLLHTARECILSSTVVVRLATDRDWFALGVKIGRAHV